MIYESCFDFEKYIQEHLREIEDLDKRSFYLVGKTIQKFRRSHQK